MGSEDDSLSIPTHERMASLATTKASAVRHKMKSGQTAKGADYEVDLNDAYSIIEQWAEAPKKAAEKILEHYGPPNESTPTKLFWYRTGPWRRMILTDDEIVHNFPTPHTDYLTQYVGYAIPPETVSDLVRFDGSVLVDRTAGEVGARCDHEAYNILTLNLVHEIVTGARSVEDARKLYAETAAAYSMGRPAPYAEHLLFEPAGDEAADPDEAVLKGAMAHQTVEKMKDVLGAPDAMDPT